MKQTTLLLSVLSLLLSTTDLQAASVSLNPTQDNTLYESVNGGASNGSGEYIFIGNTGSFEKRRGLMAFDVASSVPAGSTITSVEVAVVLSKAPSLPGGTTHDFKLHRASAAWGEGASDAGTSGGQGAAALPGDATWVHTFSPSSSWTTLGGDFVAAASGTTSIGTALATYTWASEAGMVADVQHWLDNPSQDFGWIVIGDESASKTARRFGSGDHLTPALRPTLTVTYNVPEPSAVTLALLACLGLVCKTRSNKITAI